MSQYKAIIFDVDKTLVSDDSLTITPRVFDSIQKAKEKVGVSIATSRSILEVKDLISYLGLTSPCIVSGGAQVIDPCTGKLLYERYLSQEKVQAVHDLAANIEVPMALNTDHGLVPYETETLKFNCLGIYTSPSVLTAKAKLLMSGLSTIRGIDTRIVRDYKDGYQWVIINHSEATKEKGIDVLLKYLHIQNAEIIGVGDGANDVPLLNACGLKVAVGNAVPELKMIADYIAPSVTEDGVADVINRFILDAPCHP